MERTLDTILTLLGGDASVAAALNCGQSAISNWKSRGIPKGRWVDLVMLGSKRGIAPPITLDEIAKVSRAREAA